MNIATHFGRTSKIMALSALLLVPSATVFADEAAFKKVCSSCHSGGVKGWMSGAPNVKKKQEWTEYHQRHNEEEMRAIVINGFNDHKVKGGCKSCSDDEINEALDFIFANTK
ncbi:hypothetical protein F9L16_04515 [Agarivorans sp. B2Z047]|uniref:c-type cytochrome n=1 Tax=Agarivorans sp. B2Z047 TaxID=2652721 RepID=UPI00128E08D7|nr:c-type cytochrome [Agarivorans sp. B2Z047]MPW28262.1 hypothetical protein [Agarivorans sp. B2Z047]UQN43910.1 c-type cytochrome [Agarivorans sp. B2Z047]